MIEIYHKSTGAAITRDAKERTVRKNPVESFGVAILRYQKHNQVSAFGGTSL